MVCEYREKCGLYAGKYEGFTLDKEKVGCDLKDLEPIICPIYDELKSKQEFFGAIKRANRSLDKILSNLEDAGED